MVRVSKITCIHLIVARPFYHPYLNNWYVPARSSQWEKGKLGSMEPICYLITDAVINTFNIVN